jgi:hypothetical protein
MWCRRAPERTPPSAAGYLSLWTNSSTRRTEGRQRLSPLPSPVQTVPSGGGPAQVLHIRLDVPTFGPLDIRMPRPSGQDVTTGRQPVPAAAAAAQVRQRAGGALTRPGRHHGTGVAAGREGWRRRAAARGCCEGADYDVAQGARLRARLPAPGLLPSRAREESRRRAHVAAQGRVPGPAGNPTTPPGARDQTFMIQTCLPSTEVARWLPAIARCHVLVRRS